MNECPWSRWRDIINPTTSRPHRTHDLPNLQSTLFLLTTLYARDTPLFPLQKLSRFARLSIFSTTYHTTINMSGTSNVGQAGVYEAGDQRNPPQSETNQAERFREGKENSHSTTDAKDQRSIANRLDDESRHQEHSSQSGKDLSAEDIAGQADPTAPARMHGNEPSKGAKIDKELEDEEAAIIAKKDAAKKN